MKSVRLEVDSDIQEGKRGKKKQKIEEEKEHCIYGSSIINIADPHQLLATKERERACQT